MEKTGKSKTIQKRPEGFHTVTPYLVVDNAAGLIDFIQKAFDGKLKFIMKHEDKKVMHATITIGDSTIMLADTMEGMSPQLAMLYLYLDDVDSVFKKAVQAKGTPIQQPKNEFYGDRAGAVKDEWGNVWWISTHVEDVDQQELERRAKQAEKERKEKGDEVHA